MNVKKKKILIATILCMFIYTLCMYKTETNTETLVSKMVDTLICLCIRKKHLCS